MSTLLAVAVAVTLSMTATSAATAPAEPPVARNRLADLPAPELWAAIVRADGLATVGLRAAEQTPALRAVLAELNVQVLRIDEFLPMVTVRLSDERQASALRALSFVEYVEPAASPILSLSTSTGGIGGCSNGGPACSPDDWASLGLGLPQTIPSGDYVPWNYYRHRIPEAWTRATGAGVRVAWIDTGVYANQLQIANTERFTTYGPLSATCSHGTRVGATIAAVKDGRSIVGVAYDARGISVKSMEGVLISADDMPLHEAIIQGIRAAITAEAKIINLSFGSLSWIESIAREIMRVHLLHNVLFIAAAGTNIRCPGIASVSQEPGSQIAFPASMGPEVIAVGGSDLHNPRAPHASAFAGPAVDVTAVLDWHVPSSGEADQLVDFGGTSDAAAVISGIAALVWSRYPLWTRDQVQERLFGSAYPVRDPLIGWGPVNAYRAVGGFEGVWIDGPYSAPFNSRYTLTARPTGAGPFSYRWSTGETSASITKAARCVRGSSTIRHTVLVTDLVEGKTISTPWTVMVEGDCFQ